MDANRGAIVIVAALMASAPIAACSDGGGSDTATTNSAPATASSTTIPQPPLGRLNELTRGKLAPDSRRVDLEVPSFSDPTEVTNPLFPVSELQSAVLLGRVDGEPLRVEVTLLPETKPVVDWDGREVETIQSQFVGYLDGRIAEAAVDLYAQADDGAVWYFGEDVYNYERGRAVDTEGTWHAGVDGPSSMIMPADPQVGDAYRSENVPGLVFFEESRVKSTGETVRGPTGPVEGAILGQELHFPGDREDKTFAPGYGEFFSGTGGDVEAMALAVPIDELPGPPARELETISDEIFDQARSRDWQAASATVRRMTDAWNDFRVGEVPPKLEAQLNRALNRLAQAVATRNSGKAGYTALDVAEAGLDLQLRHLPPVEIDRARFDIWLRRLLLDAAARNAAGATGDVTTLEWIRDRLALEGSDASSVDDQLRHLGAVTDAREFGVAADEAARLRKTLAGLEATT